MILESCTTLFQNYSPLPQKGSLKSQCLMRHWNYFFGLNRWTAPLKCVSNVYMLSLPLLGVQLCWNSQLLVTHGCLYHCYQFQARVASQYTLRLFQCTVFTVESGCWITMLYWFLIAFSFHFQSSHSLTCQIHFEKANLNTQTSCLISNTVFSSATHPYMVILAYTVCVLNWKLGGSRKLLLSKWLLVRQSAMLIIHSL